MKPDPRAGQVRISGQSPVPGMALTSMDLRLDVFQADGTTIPLRGVVNASLEMSPSSMVEAVVTLEIEAIDVADPAVVAIRQYVPESPTERGEGVE